MDEIEKKIKIIETYIVKIKDRKKYIKNDEYAKYFEGLLTKEELKLKMLRDNYPEYFI
jgi:hypothetical protein